MGVISQFTSESVGEGHPDKIADQISDAVLDACLAGDPDSHVGCETFVTSGLVVVGGEITSASTIDIAAIARAVVRDIGYDNGAFGLDYRSMAVVNVVNPQSKDIDDGIRKDKRERAGSVASSAADADADANAAAGGGASSASAASVSAASSSLAPSIGAGDQGIMFGYACNETPELMPIALVLAHRIMRRAAHVRKHERIKWLGPDCKCQVTIDYEDETPRRVHTVVLSHQHTEEVDQVQVSRLLSDKVIGPVIAESGLDAGAGGSLGGRGNSGAGNSPGAGRNSRAGGEAFATLINPSGRFVIGGPQADAGLTGRKIISDSYGGAARHGGGAFSGKDPSKVDRSAAYMARKVAKNIVAAELATRCEIQLSYAIGVPEPISITLYTFGTERVAVSKIERAVRAVFHLNPTAIINELSLKQPLYRNTATFGHFGRPEFPWEACDRVEALRAAL